MAYPQTQLVVKLNPIVKLNPTIKLNPMVKSINSTVNLHVWPCNQHTHVVVHTMVNFVVKPMVNLVNFFHMCGWSSYWSKLVKLGHTCSL